LASPDSTKLHKSSGPPRLGGREVTGFKSGQPADQGDSVSIRVNTEVACRPSVTKVWGPTRALLFLFRCDPQVQPSIRSEGSRSLTRTHHGGPRDEYDNLAGPPPRGGGRPFRRGGVEHSRRARRIQLRRRRLVVASCCGACHRRRDGRLAEWIDEFRRIGRPRRLALTSVPSRPVRGLLEAGVEAWSLPTPLSREVVVANGSGTRCPRADSTRRAVRWLGRHDKPLNRFDRPCHIRSPSLVHDASVCNPRRSHLCVRRRVTRHRATIQSIPTPSLASTAGGTGSQVGLAPRSEIGQRRGDHEDDRRRSAPDNGVRVGGYTGSTYLSRSLQPRTAPASAWSRRSRTGEVPGSGDGWWQDLCLWGPDRFDGDHHTSHRVIPEIDPVTHHVGVVGHLPQALYGASAFLIGGDYLRGWRTGAKRTTLTDDRRLRHPSNRFSKQGCCPRPSLSVVTPPSVRDELRSGTWLEEKWRPSPGPTKPGWHRAP